jgi:hypothetical protein
MRVGQSGRVAALFIVFGSDRAAPEGRSSTI